MLHLIAVGLLIGTSVLHAQYQRIETLAVRLGGGFASTTHSATLSNAGGIVDCGLLTTGSGMGPGGYLGMEIPMASWGALGLEVGLTNRSGDFSRTNTYPLRDSVTGAEVTMTTDYQLSTTLSNLDISAQLQLPLIGTLTKRTLGLSIGPRIALPMTASYVQRESVVSPETAVFIENGIPVQERVIRQGALQTRSSLLVMFSSALESFIPLSERLSLVPRVSLDYALNDVLTDAPWKPLTIRLDVALRLSLTRAPQFAPPPPPAIVVEQPMPQPTFAPPRLELQPRSFTGEIVTGNQLRALTPIVNAVFFDSSRADVPASYRQTANLGTMSGDAVAAHDWILPRIAAIVASNPSARIVLEGATSGPSTEPEGSALARRRAEAVRSALVALGVPSSSIGINPLVTPRIASNADLPGGRAENRRVDIIVQNAPLQRFVLTEEFAELRGLASVSSRFQGGPPESQPAEQTITINGRDTVIASLDATVTTPITVRLDNSGQPPASIATSSSAGGQYAEMKLTVPTEKLTRRRIALSTDGFEAVLRFDYNSAELLDDVKTLLRQLTEQLPEGATIVIEGSADILGSQERNRQLSNSRAANTESYIRSVSTKKFTFATTSLASPFSDDTPQGRFLNRSIRIRVK
ncbi:MAG: OmpA family protein [Bacteroidota bacterium]|jgi:outer membrane protein OmpA-like peptidoglycan-associated protein